jgi:glycosyltransferase involved in cell wall biosynthesis/Tfp pilus assembly protein PilF
MIHQFADDKLKAVQATASEKTSEELRRELDDLLAIYPDFAPALKWRARLWEETCDLDQAVACCERSVAANHGDVASSIQLAGLYQRQARPEAAAKALERALEVEPTNAEALSLLHEVKGRRSPGASPSQSGVPLVSAIVSAYKSGRFLRGCLEDLERQTIAEQIEIIVVDSHSPDNERAIVEEVQKRFSNIVYIRTDERETVYGAWNRAVKAARGKYLTTANTDDRHRRDALEVLAQTLDQHPDIALVYADCLITTTENEPFESARPIGEYRWREFDPKDLLLKGCFCGPQPMWRREVHREYGFFDPELVSAGDYEFWLRLAQTCKFLHVRQFLGLYLKSPSSVEHSNREVGAREVNLAQQRYRDCILHGKPPFIPAAKSIPAAQAVPVPRPAKPAAIPPVARMGELSKAREHFGRKDYSAAWTAAYDAVGKRPFHPEGFLLLAEIALATGAETAARQCAHHARDLAPGWKAPKQFLKKQLQGNTGRADLSSLRFGQPPRLTVCLIARNEERFIGQCLKSVQGLANQIILVDTGSEDGTVAIAKQLGAEVHSFPWSDDFSAARNAALEHATGDWVLILDADEELPAAQHERLRADMGQKEVIACRLPLANVGQNDGHSYLPRLFRNAPGVFFHGRIHEQVFPSLIPLSKAWGLDIELGTAELLHHGYTKELVKERNKIERNLRLLQLAVQESPDDANLAMNLGLELVRSGNIAEGLARYRDAFRLLSAPGADVPPELREAFLGQFTTHLYRIQAHQEVVDALTSPLARNGGLTATLHFALGLSYFELKRYSEAAQEMRQCLAKRTQRVPSPINTDIHTAAPHHCLALSLVELKDFAEAEKAFTAALAEKGKLDDVKVDYARLLFRQRRPVEALQVLHQVVSRNAQHARAWKLGCDIAGSSAEFLEFFRDWSSEAIRYLPADPTVVGHRAEALLLSQDTDQARPLWERVCNCARPPKALAALILCSAVDSGDIPATRTPAEEKEASRAFIEWYQRLISVGARETIDRVNSKLDSLRQSIPTAAGLLHAALQEAEVQA